MDPKIAGEKAGLAWAKAAVKFWNEVRNAGSGLKPRFPAVPKPEDWEAMGWTPEGTERLPDGQAWLKEYAKYAFLAAEKYLSVKKSKYKRSA